MKPTPAPPRIVLRLLAYLALGFAASVGVAWALSSTMDLTLGRMQTSQAYASATETRWSVTRWVRVGGMLAVSTRAVDRAWGRQQVAGPPDTTGFGDIVTAWASSSTDGQQEWLELTYERAVTPAEVHVYETYNPGAVHRVTAFTDAGEEVEAWTGVDPVPQKSSGGVAKIPLRVDFPTRRVKVYLDSPRVPGWNEIDAVGLVDAAGGVQWATGVKASTVYGSAASDTTTTPAPGDLAPRWSGLAKPGEDLVAHRVKSETRAVAAYGWPMLAFWDERDAGATQAQVQAKSATPAVPPGPETPIGTLVERTTLARTRLDPAGMPGATPAGTPVTVTPPAGPPAPAPRTRMPARPIWRGLAVNTLVFAGLIALLHWVAVWPIRLSREVSRVRTGRCIECGYDVGYAYLNGCPECGWRRSGEEQTSGDPRGAPLPAEAGRPAPL